MPRLVRATPPRGQPGLLTQDDAMEPAELLRMSMRTMCGAATESAVRTAPQSLREAAMDCVIATWQPEPAAELWQGRAVDYWRAQQPEERGIDPVTLWLIGVLISVAIQVVVRWWLNHRDTDNRRGMLAEWRQAIRGGRAL